MAPADDQILLLGSGATVPLAQLVEVTTLGTTFHRHPDGRLLAMAFRGRGVDLGRRDAPGDEQDLADVVLAWIDAVNAEDWSEFRGSALEDQEWTDLRTAMVRVGWGPLTAQAAWRRARSRPYHHDLPTAAGWAGGGWVVPAVPDDLEPAFASPVLESRGLLRWAYIARWETPPALGELPLPTALDPFDSPAWSEVLSRFSADHYTDTAAEEAEQLALEVLSLVDLGPANVIEAEDDPLPDRYVEAACNHASPVVRAAAWFLLRSEALTWEACAYGECQHHWAVEAEEDAFEHAEVLELAAHGVANPVDAAMVRRRLLTDAFGDINDVALAGQSDPSDFIAFYRDWVATGRSMEVFEAAVEQLRGDHTAG